MFRLNQPVNETEFVETVNGNFLLTVYAVDFSLSGFAVESPRIFLTLKKFVGKTKSFWSGRVISALNLLIPPLVTAAAAFATNVKLLLVEGVDASCPMNVSLR